MSTNNEFLTKWRELGFYFDFDNRLEVNQWRFYGSKTGYESLLKILDEYSFDVKKYSIGQHEHYGPYWNLKVMTTSQPRITNDGFEGTIADFTFMKSIIQQEIDEKNPGMTFNIHEKYGVDNEVTTRFFVMADDFDPSSLDELIMSDRQSIVNNG